MSISILGILFCHYNECRTLHGLASNVFSKSLNYLTCFVDVFLLLSAIGLVYSFTKDANIKRFYKKRATRILPNYVIICLPYWIAYDCGKVAGEGITQALCDFSFVSFIIDGVARYWFVFAIIVLYILFPVIYRGMMRFKNRFVGCFFCLMVSIAVQALLIVSCADIYNNINLFVERIPIFIFGVYCGIACIEDKEVHLPRILCVFALAILFQVINRVSLPGCLEEYLRYYSKSLLGLVAIVAICLILEQIENKCAGLWHIIKWISGYLGSATLEIYIFHSLIKNLSDYPSDFSWYMVFVVILPLITGITAHYLIETGKNKIISLRN